MPRARRPDPRSAPRPAGHPLAPRPEPGRALVWALAALYAAGLTFVCAVKYRYYLYTDFDFAIFVQAVSGILRGTLYSSIRGMSWLGDHSSPVLFLVAPLYAIAPHPVTLLAVQSVALALGAIPVHRLAERRFGPGFVATGFAALYLAYPALGYVNLFEFHPESLSTAALLFAFDYADQGRLRPAALWAVLALAGREDAALVVATMGLVLLATRRPRAPVLAATLVGLAAASLIVSFAILRPRLGTGEAQYIEMYRAWGHSAGEVIATVLRHPLRALEWMAATPGDATDSLLKRQWYVHMLLPLLGLPLASPWTLAIAAPIVAEHFLSWRQNQHSIVCQYTALVTPFAVAAAVLGLANLLRVAARGADVRVELARGWSRTRVLATIIMAAALLASLGSNLAFGPLLGRGRLQAFKPTQRFWPNLQDRTLRPYRDRLAERVPKGVGVVTSFEYLPRFAARENVHSFHHLFDGHYTFSTKPFPIPIGIGAMLTALGNQYTPEAAARERRLIETNRLEPVDGFDDVVLYLRSPADTLDLLAVGDLEPSITARLLYDGMLRFKGCDVPHPRVGAGEELTLRTYWVREAPGDSVYVTRLWLFDDQGQSAFYRTRYLGYGVFTVGQWPAGRTVRETYRLVVPGGLAPGSYRLVMQLVRRGAAGVAGAAPAVPDDPKLVRMGGLVVLSTIEIG